MSNARLVSRIFAYGERDLIQPERDTYVVFYKNNNSFGNRYESSDQVIASKQPKNEGHEISAIQASALIYKFEWNQIFNLIEHQIFNGPLTLAALEKSAEIVKSAEFPKEDPKKLVSAWNGVARTLVTELTKSYMDLQGRVQSILVPALYDDKANNQLLSTDWKYHRVIRSGWSRST